jgi:hypothetical protein
MIKVPTPTNEIDAETNNKTNTAAESVPKAVEPLDPFDPEALRLDQSFIETSGVKKLLTTVPVRKPSPQDFVRTHRDPNYRRTFTIIELREDREIYLLRPEIARELPGEFVLATLYTAINRQGVMFLWPIKLPGPDGKVLEWHRSAAEAAELALQRWVRVKANMALGAYEITEAVSVMAEPSITVVVLL